MKYLSSKFGAYKKKGDPSSSIKHEEHKKARMLRKSNDAKKDTKDAKPISQIEELENLFPPHQESPENASHVVKIEKEDIEPEKSSKEKESSFRSTDSNKEKSAEDESKLTALLKFVGIVGGIYFSFSMVAYSQEKYLLQGGKAFPFIQSTIVYFLTLVVAIPTKYLIFKDYSNQIPVYDSVLVGIA